jgi:tetratricopeptide (TPR) repeat protein
MADHAASHSVLIIEAAISVFEEVLQLRPVEHECRAEALGDLGNALFFFCYHNEANHSRCARCIDLLRGALQLCPPGHSSRDRALHNLARALLFLGYEQQSIGCLGSLKESILLNREALQLRPTGHPGRRDSLNNLACGLQRLFENSGDLTLISESISMHRQALELGHRELSFRNLALALDSSFQHQGGAEAHAEAIRLNREALKLVPVGHPLRWAPLMNLGNTLARSYATTGFPEMLSESIRLHREAVRLLPLTHRDYGLALGNLADSLVASLRHDPDPHVLAEAITFLRHSLHLPSGESDRADRINSLAEALVTSFDEHNELDHLHEAVKLHREALVSRPPGHFRRMESLQGLGRLLCRTECQSWTEALAVYREALDNCPTGSPHRSGVLSDISRCFLEPASPFFDLQQGITYLSDAFSDNFCHVNRRLRLAMPDLLRLESTLNKAATSLDDYNSSLERCNAQVLDLYSQVISLLPRAANFGLDHSTRLQAVTGLDEISRNAAARAIILRRESEAVEMLEEGRGVFWAQALHLRTSAFDDVPQEDRQELQRLLSLLEHSARRVESSDKDAAQREYDLERRRQLNEQAEALISKIRCYAGLDRFLLPPIFETLVHALPDGFVAIVNASKLGYHALLLHRDTGLATSITLQSPPKGFDSAILRSHLPRDVGSAKCEVDVSRAMRKDNGRGGSLLDMLAVLWTSIVQPVVAQLGLQVRYNPRIWVWVLNYSISERSWSRSASTMVVCYGRARLPPDSCGR